MSRRFGPVVTLAVVFSAQLTQGAWAEEGGVAYVSKPVLHKSAAVAKLLEFTGVNVTVTFDRSAQSFRDGRSVFERQLEAIRQLAEKEGIAIKGPDSAFYNIYVTEGNHYVNGSAAFLLGDEENAARFIELVQKHGFGTGQAEMCLH